MNTRSKYHLLKENGNRARKPHTYKHINMYMKLHNNIDIYLRLGIIPNGIDPGDIIRTRFLELGI